MGGGNYSVSNRAVRSATLNYATKDIGQIFTRKNLVSQMNPKGVELRESRDSAEHPKSISIVLGLDVTGSMGKIPHILVKDGLPKIMSRIMDVGVKDPQILFLGIGDHRTDSAPLQIGQFESSDELMDKWLTEIFLEGGGGGNDGESYSLAWYFAGKRTSIDCFEKRNIKGFLFTIGDEPVHESISKESLNAILGGEERGYTSKELLEVAREKYHVFHIHISHGVYSSSNRVIGGWKNLMGDGLLVVENKEEIPNLIPAVIADVLGLDREADVSVDLATFDMPVATGSAEEMLL